MTAPKNDSMIRHTDLEAANGAVVRQVAQKLESVAQTLGLPYEAKNQYKLSLLPSGRQVAKSPGDKARWIPSAEDLLKLDSFLFVKEESSFITRFVLALCGCLNLRPLKLHFSVDPASGDAYLVNRDFKMGGGCCCPLIMDMFEVSGTEQQPSRVRIGRVRENFDNYCQRCAQACCSCTVYHDIERSLDGSEEFETAYQLRATMCCCGRVNNCCGGTCCKNDMVSYSTLLHFLELNSLRFLIFLTRMDKKLSHTCKRLMHQDPGLCVVVCTPLATTFSSTYLH